MLTELKWLLQNFFVESDMSFVYIDRINDAIIAHRDFYGKRSLIIQANHIEETSVDEILFSSV